MDLPLEILRDRAERRGWCEAVSYSKSVRKRVNANERLRVDIDAAATRLSLGSLSARQLRQKAAMHMRYNEGADTIISVRAAIKRARRESA